MGFSLFWGGGGRKKEAGGRKYGRYTKKYASTCTLRGAKQYQGGQRGTYWLRLTDKDQATVSQSEYVCLALIGGVKIMHDTWRRGTPVRVSCVEENIPGGGGAKGAYWLRLAQQRIHSSQPVPKSPRYVILVGTRPSGGISRAPWVLYIFPVK